MARLAWAGWAMALAAGACAPRQVLVNPAGWPAEWRGRKLFTTPNAFLYASSPQAARDIDEVLIAVGRDFSRQTSGQTTRGLLVVTAADDPAWCDDLPSLHQRIGRPATRPAREEYEAWLAEIDATGVPPAEAINAMPIALSPDDVVALLKLPATVGQAVPWALALPTRGRLKGFTRKVVAAGMKKEGVGALEQVMLAPVLALVEGSAIDLVAAQRDIAVFRAHAQQQRAWTPRERERAAETYERKRMKEAMGLLGGLMPDPQPATRPGP